MSLQGEPTTVFVPIMETTYDNEYGPHVYEGELSREQVLAIGRILGGLGKKDRGYARVAIEGTGDPGDGWYLTFHSEEANEGDCVQPNKHEHGESYADTPGSGALAYSVEYREFNQPPS